MARGKIIKKLASKMARKRDAKKKYITEDGYVFEKKADGSLTDGDMTYKSLDELKKWVDVKPYSGPRPKKMRGGGIAKKGLGKVMK